MTKTIIARCQLITYCPICDFKTKTCKHDCCNSPDSDTYMPFSDVEILVGINKLPINVNLSHYDQGKKIKIGQIINWTNNKKALTATILLDNELFIKAIVLISEFYFGQRNLQNDPLLYLQKLFPGFSLCHNKYNLIVDHVAAVCVPKRRGSIADYEWSASIETHSRSNNKQEFVNILLVLMAVTSEGLTINNRTDLLKQNLKFSPNRNNTEFVYAGIMKEPDHNYKLLEIDNKLLKNNQNTKIFNMSNEAIEKYRQFLLDLLSKSLDRRKSDDADFIANRLGDEGIIKEGRKRTHNESLLSEDIPIHKQIKNMESEQNGLKKEISELKEQLKQQILQTEPSKEILIQPDPQSESEQQKLRKDISELRELFKQQHSQAEPPKEQLIKTPPKPENDSDLVKAGMSKQVTKSDKDSSLLNESLPFNDLISIWALENMIKIGGIK